MRHRHFILRLLLAALLCLGLLCLCAAGLGPVWQSVSAGEGLYEALARFVGGMIGAR